MTIQIPDEDLEDADALARALYAVIQSKDRPREEHLKMEFMPRADGSFQVNVGPKPRSEIVK